MAVEPQYTDEVKVILKPVNSGPKDIVYDRQILLTKSNLKLDIGRSTKRDAKLAAKPGNGWFDSPVMSRNHARLLFSPKHNAVSVIDVGSRHGTYVNNNRIRHGQPQQLASSDVLRFGVPILKGRDTFPACELRVSLQQGLSNREERPLVFKVPDSSDEEDNISEVDADINSSLAIMKRVGIASSQQDQTTIVGAIDLTGDNPSAMDAPTQSSSPHAGDDSTPNDQPELGDGSSPRSRPEELEHPESDSEPSAEPLDSNCSPVAESEEAELSSPDEEIADCQEKTDVSGVVDSDFRHHDLHEVDDAVSEDNDASDSILGHDCSSNARGLDNESITSSPPGHANVEAVSMSVISRPRSGLLDATAENPSATSKRAEFFAAREHNRRVHSTYNRSELRANISSNDGTGVHTALSFDNQYPSGMSVFGPPESQICTSTADLLASGDKFLQTPLEDGSNLDKDDMEDLFADTSAFTFEMSKKTIEQADNKAGSLETDTTSFGGDTTKPSQSSDEPKISKKRKSDDISKLLGSEMAPGSSQTQPEASQPILRAEASPSSRLAGSSAMYIDLTSHAEWPVKRLRRAAEILGYAAIGGVAVMSALIATAPAL